MSQRGEKVGALFLTVLLLIFQDGMGRTPEKKKEVEHERATWQTMSRPKGSTSRM